MFRIHCEQHSTFSTVHTKKTVQQNMTSTFKYTILFMSYLLNNYSNLLHFMRINSIYSVALLA
jgi:hypothetical protein